MAFEHLFSRFRSCTHNTYEAAQVVVCLACIYLNHNTLYGSLFLFILFID